MILQYYLQMNFVFLITIYSVWLIIIYCIYSILTHVLCLIALYTFQVNVRFKVIAGLLVSLASNHFVLISVVVN